MAVVDAAPPSVVDADAAIDPLLPIQSNAELSGTICSPAKSSVCPLVVTGTTKEVCAHAEITKSFW